MINEVKPGQRWAFRWAFKRNLSAIVEVLEFDNYFDKYKVKVLFGTYGSGKGGAEYSSDLASQNYDFVPYKNTVEKGSWTYLSNQDRS